jgi:hypothetical protein
VDRETLHFTCKGLVRVNSGWRTSSGQHNVVRETTP